MSEEYNDYYCCVIDIYVDVVSMRKENLWKVERINTNV